MVSRTYQIDRIVFGTAVFIEPAGCDKRASVPMWKFFGSFVASDDLDGVASTCEERYEISELSDTQCSGWKCDQFGA